MPEGSSEAWWARRPWLAAVLLYLPMAALYLQPFLWVPPGSWQTGFLQYDQASYMAMAREYFDAPGGFSLLYGNPFSPDPETPRLFFQPWTLLLGLIEQASGIDPGTLYLLFGAVSGLVMLRLTIALYRRLPPAEGIYAGVGLILLCWGGGLFFLAGLVDSLNAGVISSSSFFVFDPAHGLWFLNLGRNLFYSSEAFYHALAIGLLIALVDRRWVLAVGLAVLLIASHPFAGTQLALVALGWCVVERLFDRKAPPLAVPAALLVLLALALAYYLLFLPANSHEHVSLEQRWRYPAETWSVPLVSQLLGWGPVLLLAIVAFARRYQPFDRRTRLLGVMALGSLLLANHELFLTANQPLHFTRGHVWMPLMLLALPALQRAMDWLAQRWRPLAAGLAALFLIDNASWLSIQLYTNTRDAGYALSLDGDQKAAMDRLRDPALADYLLVNDDHAFALLVTVYTQLRTWASHLVSTPYAVERYAEIDAWLAAGDEVPAWRARPVVFLRAYEGDDPAALPWAEGATSIERFGRLLLVVRPAMVNGEDAS